MSIADQYDRGWVLTRSLAFIFVFVLRIVIELFVRSFSWSIGTPMVLGCSALLERLALPADWDPATDLRVFYLVVD